nr:hypothetical protein Itr_chr02CG24570 [Ipomoea trifida]GMC59098.1 hypothetical protein Iba_chr02aCG21590 [Ipomoea batatas]GMC61707.1 hypothetical protein Iba_chr02bCG22590 [Ipomoea batatas]GMC63699.1 hypothetical protein Iba_chr02cCG15760 [Ipomoea batatas]GME13571.1 hypothetical protein Iba_scaffold14541.2CG0550 [Ipomoea batatas]
MVGQGGQLPVTAPGRWRRTVGVALDLPGPILAVQIAFVIFFGGKMVRTRGKQTEGGRVDQWEFTTQGVTKFPFLTRMWSSGATSPIILLFGRD